MTKQYTNELTSELLAELNKPSHTPEQMSTLPEEAQQIIVKHMEDDRLHPVNTIYRFAVEGSLTRDGGIIQTGTTEMIIFENSSIYDNATYSLSWALWHDPRTHFQGPTKDSNESKKGYERAKILWGPDTQRAHDHRKLYGIHRNHIESFINEHLRELR